ncbi:MAG: hypothetical protein HKN49_08000 [Gammaproteobacteria bacterium]|nr:hypothetical protein [Gammaproteobacteria bacterium]
MKAFLQWIVARRMRMALVAAALSLLPLVGLLAQSVVVVAVLFSGVVEGAIVALIASAILTAPVVISGGAALPMLGVMAATWLPVIALAHLLRESRSLSLVLQVSTMVVAAVVLLAFLLGDPISGWQTLLDEFADQLPVQFQELQRDAAAQIMTGMLGVVVLLGSLLALFIGRWWQSILQKPGAFGLEFRQARLGLVIAVIASLTFVAAGLTSVPVLTNLTLVFTAAYLLQGLAVVHTLAAVTATGMFWLVSSYALLIVAAPLAMLALASLGFVDSWFDLRRRLAAK